MKAVSMLLFPFVVSICAFADTMVTDIYDFKMNIKVPRVFSNSSSQGYRKYQSQIIRGKMLVKYDIDSPYSEPVVILTNLVNKTHVVAGNGVRYSSEPCEKVSWHYIGDNRKGSFATPSVSFYAELDPSYNISQKVDEDNSLLITLSGNGSSSTARKYRGVRGCRTVCKLSGYAAGTIGCGCFAYGHLSPTRMIGPYGPWMSVIPDVASVHGKWKASFNKSMSGVVTEEDLSDDSDDYEDTYEDCAL